MDKACYKLHYNVMEPLSLVFETHNITLTSSFMEELYWDLSGKMKAHEPKMQHVGFFPNTPTYKHIINRHFVAFAGKCIKKQDNANKPQISNTRFCLSICIENRIGGHIFLDPGK